MIETNHCRASSGRTVARVLVLGFLLTSLLASAMAGQKQLTLTTSSQQAKDLLTQAVESFDNPKATQLAKEAVKADSNFAFAQMLVAALSPPPQRQPLLDKIKALAPSASPGEQQYFESGDYKAAAEHLEQADQNDPFHKLLLARASLKLGDKAYALQNYQEIVKTNFSNMERALAYPEAKKMVTQLNGTN